MKPSALPDRPACGRAVRLLMAGVVLMLGLFSGNAASAVSRVAYVYGSDPTASANAFAAMLTGAGVTVDVYSDAQAALATTDFSPDQAIIIADDMPVFGGGSSFANIQSAAKPIVAIGQWGSAFLGYANPPMVAAGTGFLTSGSDYLAHVADPAAPIWSTPSPVTQINQSLALYTQAVPVYALGNPQPIQMAPRIARLPGDPNHYSIIADAVGAVCYTFWGYRGSASLMTPSAKNLFLNVVFGSPCTAGSYTVNAALAYSPPVLDGTFSYGEWSLTPNRIEMDHGFVLVMNDYFRLYLLLDVMESSINNTGANQNDFWVTIDVDNNGQINPGIDMNYALAGGSHNMRYQHYVNPAQWDLLSTSTKSSLGPGFDCYTPDNTKVLNINTQMFDCAPHQLWEIAIDLKEINAVPGQTIHLGLRTNSPNPDFVDELPNSFDVDFSNLITVHLAGIPAPPHDPNANLAFVTPFYEITQVVQNVTNTIPLVADKATAGRTSVITTMSASPQPVLEYLYGQRGGEDLPGSPLVQLMSAPLTISRANLSDTANFPLPASWIGVGEVTFHAEAADFNGHSVTTPPQTLTFQHKARPVYWFIQENIGTANAVSLPTQASIDSYESYVKTVFPVPDVKFVQKAWTALGALNGASLDTNVDAVDKYYSAIAAAYWNAIMMNLPPPYELPQMIFGAGNFGGGISTPTWFNNGSGRAAVGGNASSGEGVAAHEFNHDLDRSSNGTWGRHVNACGATGPDPNWPGGTDPSITEYGFDTRQPWQSTTTTKTVIPPTMPDLMSYCGSGYLPTKWVSPYRYLAWFGSAQFPSLPAGGPSNALYISGALDVGGTGSLDPVLRGAGMPIAPSPVGGYSVEISGIGIPTITHAFDVVFQDIDGNPLDVVPFNFVLPDPGPGVSMIRLLHGMQVLAVINKSANPPTGAFTAPGAGPIAGNVLVGWTVTPGDTPLSGLRLQLQFSGDGGSTFIPVAVNLPGTQTSFFLDASLVPMTADGRLRLLILDGLNVVAIDSGSLLAVGNHPPFVNILAPIDPVVPPGSQSLLQGQATDIDEPDLPDSRFLWTLDGTTTLGVGRSVQASLPDGPHTLTLTVQDSNGATGTASRKVNVTMVDASATLDVDASGSGTRYDALTDGLIVLRYMFGLTGASMTNGAIGPTATRGDPASLKAYLDGMSPLLDIDGNGNTDALTDGLMLLRYLFGLRGNSLIHGAVAPDAIRTGAPAIEAYIQSLMP